MELTVRAPLPPDRRPFFWLGLLRAGIATVTLAHFKRQCTRPSDHSSSKQQIFEQCGSPQNKHDYHKQNDEVELPAPDEIGVVQCHWRGRTILLLDTRARSAGDNAPAHVDTRRAHGKILYNLLFVEEDHKALLVSLCTAMHEVDVGYEIRWL